MTCIILPSDNPFFNLAAEEFFLKSSANDFLLLYVNRPSVIAGRHQNLFAEINYPYVKENDILLCRRMTGGGAVYHDQGNINFAFIENGEEGKLANQKKFTSMVVKALQHFGLDAEAGPRSEITLGGLKLSGCAEHVHKSRILHHGTLLFSADLDSLDEALRPSAGYADKAVQSVRSKVTNICQHLEDKSKTVSVFKKELVEYFLHSGLAKGIRRVKISEAKEIDALMRCKYSTWEWNVSFSPDYTIERSVELKKGMVKVRAEVQSGLLRNIALESDGALSDDMEKAGKKLTGKRMDYDELLAAVKDFEDSDKLVMSLF